jgi:type 1 glutamine amidotransferase
MIDRILARPLTVLCLLPLLMMTTGVVVAGGSDSGGKDSTSEAESRSMATATQDPLSLLVYTRTSGYRHESIEDGVQALKKLCAKHGYQMQHTEDPDSFTDAGLKPYDVVIFLSTSNDVLDESQQQAFKRYIQNGGGFVGVHSASGTEYDWPWFGKLVGAYFTKHPKIQQADIRITQPDHVCMQGLSDPWTRRDEWYNFRDVQPDLTVLAKVDESSYEGGTMGDSHPIIWCHEFDGGRSFYTALGHTSESYEEPAFIELLRQGILWDAGRCMKPTPDMAGTVYDDHLGLYLCDGSETYSLC